MRQFRQLETDYQPPRTRTGTLGAWVGRVKRLIYGTRPAAGKFGRRSRGSSSFDWPLLEDVVSWSGRVEQWFGGDPPEPPPPEKKRLPAPLPEPEPVEPEQDPAWQEPPPPAAPVQIIVGPQPQIIIEVPGQYELDPDQTLPRERDPNMNPEPPIPNNSGNSSGR